VDGAQVAEAGRCHAILAYLLNLSEMVPADFVLSDKNIGEVQKLLPNRNGMTTDHGLWPGASAAKGGIGNGGKPDTQNKACMKNCKPEVLIGSTLPEYARTAHGELRDQNRSFGPVRGTQTLGPEAAKKAADAGTLELATKSGCMACHGLKSKIVGPGYNEVFTRYRGQTDAEDRLVAEGQGWRAGRLGFDPDATQQSCERRGFEDTGQVDSVGSK
jgi:cytochrome c